MKFKIVAVGKIRKKFFQQGIQDYVQRLRLYCHVEIVAVKDEKAPENLSNAQKEKVKQIEGQRILQKIQTDEYVFTLEILGKEYSSEEFAAQLADLLTYGHSKITFVIGGSLGLSSQVLQRSNQSISFGRLTMPHQLMRLVLTEQIYRAFMINAGNPYHK